MEVEKNNPVAKQIEYRLHTFVLDF